MSPAPRKAPRRRRSTAAPASLLDLLAARGPSGYEGDPTRVWLEAAGQFAQVSTDAVGTPLALVARTGQGAAPAPAGDGPHRRDRADRDPHRRRRLPVVQGSRRLGRADPRRPARRDRDELRADQRRGRKKPIHLLRDEERKKVAEIRDLHIDIGARDGEQAREMVRVGDVAVIDARPDRACPTGGSHRGPSTTGSARSWRSRRRGWLPRPEAGSGSWRPSQPSRRRSRSAARAPARSRWQPDAAIVIDVTHATDAPGIDVKQAGKHELGSGPVVTRGSTLNSELVELHPRGRQGREDRSHGRGERARDRHRRRRGPPRPRRHPDGAGVDPDPLHAFPCRDRPARRRERDGEAGGGCRPAPEARHGPDRLSSPQPVSSVSSETS